MNKPPALSFLPALCLALAAVAPAAGTPAACNILDFGAKPGLATVNTRAIQAAIDACHQQGGGKVIFPKGNFVTGTLFLKSKVELAFEERSSLLGSTSLADYAEVPVATEEPQFSKCLFYGDGVENIAITGSDTSEINGRGYYFKNSAQRPKLFRIERSRNIRLEKITIMNSGSWCMYFGGCDNIRLTGVSVYNKENKNNDGMNYDGCSNVWITDCNLQVEDDAICLKSSIDRTCENFNVEGCTVSSYHAALKFGTASAYGFRNVTVRNCRFYDCRYGTIKLLLVDGGYIDGIRISDIELFNCGGPIFLRLGNRGRSYAKSIRQAYGRDVKPEGAPVGALRNVYLGNIRGRLVGRNDAVEGILITGIPGHYIENVTIENLDLSFSGHGDLDVAHLVVPEDEARYPEQSFFGPLNSYGLYLRHAKNVRLRNIKLSLRGPDSRPALYLEDVIDSQLEDVRFELGPSAPAALLLKQVSGLKILGMKANGQAIVPSVEQLRAAQSPVSVVPVR